MSLPDDRKVSKFKDFDYGYKKLDPNNNVSVISLIIIIIRNKTQTCKIRMKVTQMIAKTSLILTLMQRKNFFSNTGISLVQKIILLS
jgi:hypothetical protein